MEAYFLHELWYAKFIGGTIYQDNIPLLSVGSIPILAYLNVFARDWRRMQFVRIMGRKTRRCSVLRVH